MGRAYDGAALYPETIAIPAGASLLINALAGQLSVLLKCGSGGSLLITNTTDSLGSSNSISTAYLMTLSEILSFDSTGGFYLSAVGATAVAYLLRIRTAGTGNP